MDWEILRKTLLSSIDSEHITDIDQIIPNDRECQRRDFFISDNLILCKGCQGIIEAVGDPEVEISKFSDIFDLPPVPLTEDILPQREMKKINPRDKTRYYRCDNPLMNTAIVSTVLEEVLDRKTSFEGIFGCCNKTILIGNGSPSIPESDTEPENLIRSLVKLLYRLKKFDFSHSKADADSLILVEDYLSIRPFEFSSITYNGVRTYYPEVRFNVFNADLIPTTKNYSFMIPEGCSSPNPMKGCTPFQRKTMAPGFNIDRNLVLMQRNLGIPLYSPEVDFYFFISSLRVIPNFYEVFDDPKNIYYGIWKGMWEVNQFPKLERDLKELSLEGKYKYDDLFPILKNYAMRSDVVDYFYSKIPKE